MLLEVRPNLQNASCVIFPFEEGDMVAYIDGEASEEVPLHIDNCVICQEEVQGLREMSDLFHLAFKAKAKPRPWWQFWRK